MTDTEYRPDQAAVDWARSCVEREITKIRGFEQQARQKGKKEQERTWRVVANSMEMDLIGRGCVIGPFHPRHVEVRAMLDDPG